MSAVVTQPCPLLSKLWSRRFIKSFRSCFPNPYPLLICQRKKTTVLPAKNCRNTNYKIDAKVTIVLKDAQKMHAFLSKSLLNNNDLFPGSESHSKERHPRIPNLHFSFDGSFTKYIEEYTTFLIVRLHYKFCMFRRSYVVKSINASQLKKITKN